MCDGETVQSALSQGQDGLLYISFEVKKAKPHKVYVTYNSEPVPGKWFECMTLMISDRQVWANRANTDDIQSSKIAAKMNRAASVIVTHCINVYVQFLARKRKEKSKKNKKKLYVDIC